MKGHGIGSQWRKRERGYLTMSEAPWYKTYFGKDYLRT